MSEKMIKAGVVGWPVSHSRSPLIHNHWIATLGLSGHYDAIAIEPDHFERDIRALMDQGYAGVNVTVPHKQAALALADKVHPMASRIGAVNTLVFPGDGSIEALNTDYVGFIENIKSGVPDIALKGMTVLVLGAGGAACAVICGLIDAEVTRVILTNRTRAKAEDIKGALGGPIEIVDWDDRRGALEGIDLLVNTTSLGMEGSAPLVLDLAALPRSAIVTDIVYAPLETDLLAGARARGNGVVDGLGMLLHQAAPSFAAWFGVMPTVDARLRQIIIDDLEKDDLEKNS